MILPTYFFPFDIAFSRAYMRRSVVILLAFTVVSCSSLPAYWQQMSSDFPARAALAQELTSFFEAEETEVQLHDRGLAVTLINSPIYDPNSNNKPWSGARRVASFCLVNWSSEIPIGVILVTLVHRDQDGEKSESFRFNSWKLDE